PAPPGRARSGIARGAPPGRSHIGPPPGTPALRRSQLHGLLARGPVALPRSRAGGVRLRAAARVVVLAGGDETTPAPGDARPRSGRGARSAGQDRVRGAVDAVVERAIGGATAGAPSRGGRRSRAPRRAGRDPAGLLGRAERARA